MTIPASPSGGAHGAPGGHRPPERNSSRACRAWLRGTHHGVGADDLDAYLDEFVFRFNRRFYPMAGFATLLGLGTAQPPTPIDRILSPLSDGATSRRRGCSTGLTKARFSIQIIERSSLDDVLADRGD